MNSNTIKETKQTWSPYQNKEQRNEYKVYQIHQNYSSRATATNLCTSPSMVTARQWLSPHAICLMRIPWSALIGWGVNKSLEFPWPNLPKSPLPNKKEITPVDWSKWMLTIKECTCLLHTRLMFFIFSSRMMQTTYYGKIRAEYSHFCLSQWKPWRVQRLLPGKTKSKFSDKTQYSQVTHSSRMYIYWIMNGNWSLYWDPAASSNAI